MFVPVDVFLFIFFFFSSRRRHTRSYGDWSSDVCSSDLQCRGNGRIIAQGSADLSVDLAERLGLCGTARPRGSQPPERDLHLAGLELPVFARAYEIGVSQVLDQCLWIGQRSQGVQP